MQYCTVTDVRFALTQSGSTSGTNTSADMDDATIQDSVDEATALVDAYVNGPYLDGDIIPAVVRFWTRDLAAFYAASVWRKSKDWTVLDPLYVRWQAAEALLVAVNTGVMIIPGPGNQGTTTDNGTVVNPVPYQLFYPWDFDLFGQPASGAGVPVFYDQHLYYYWWPGYNQGWI